MRCGNCCRPRGYVRLKDGEAESIAAFLGESVHVFVEKYTRLTTDRSGLTLIDREDRGCIFLGKDALCQIQDVKPAQCRDFPLKWRFEGYEKLCRGMSVSMDMNGEEK